MIDELVAQAARNLVLQTFDLFVDELDDLAGPFMSIRWSWCVIGHFFVARAAVAEIVSLEDAALFEKAHRAIDGGDRDAGIDRGGAAMQFFDVWVIMRCLRRCAR